MEISMEEQLKELQQKVDEKFEETPTMQDPEEEYIQMVESLTEDYETDTYDDWENDSE